MDESSLSIERVKLPIPASYCIIPQRHCTLWIFPVVWRGLIHSSLHHSDTKKEKVVVQSIKPAELLKSHTKQMQQLRTQRKANLSQAPSPAPVNPLKQAPQLGRGLQQGDDIFFGGAAGPSPQQKRAVAVSKAKVGVYLL